MRQIVATAILLSVMTATSGGQARAADLRHHFPSVLTYASLNEIPPPRNDAEVAFEIEHLDMAHGEAHFAAIKRLNPRFFYVKYRLMETMIAGEDRELETYCSTHGFDPENAFLHYSDDTVITAEGKDYLIKGEKSAAKRKESRIRNLLGVWRYVYFWSDRCTLDFIRTRSVRDITEPTKGPRFDGVFVDELGVPDVPSSIAALPRTTRGGHISEYGKTREEMIASGQYGRELGGLFAAAAAAMRQASDGHSLLLLNTASHASQGVVRWGKQSDGILTEFLSNETAPYAGIGEAQVWGVAKQLADAGKIYVLSQGLYDPPKNPTFTAGNYRSQVERHEMYPLASYWMAKQGNFTYFEQRPRWKPLSSFWLKAQEVDLGEPKGEFYIWKEDRKRGDTAGQKYRIYRRDYTKAVILFRTRYDWDATNFKDFGGQSDVFDLGGVYRVLYPDGSMGPAMSRVALSLAEGLVLLPAARSPQ